MNGSSIEQGQERAGSWVPVLILLSFVLVRWIFVGQGDIPVRTRRWLNTQVRKYQKLWNPHIIICELTIQI